MDAELAQPKQDRPKRGEAFRAGILIAASIAMLFGIFFSKQFPSFLGIRIAQSIALSAAIYLGWESRDGGRLSPSNPQFRVEMTGSNKLRGMLLKSTLARRICFSLFGFFVAFSAVEDGVLAIATLAVGRPGSRVLTITGTSSGGRGGCSKFEVQEARWLLDHALCAESGELHRSQEGDLLLVSGTESPFGIYVRTKRLFPKP